MDNESLKLIARLKIGAARLGQSIDVVRFAADPEYAKTAILRFTDLADEQGVVLALQLIDRLGFAATDAEAGANTVPLLTESVDGPAASPRPPILRRELLPSRSDDRYVGRLR